MVLCLRKDKDQTEEKHFSLNSEIHWN